MSQFLSLLPILPKEFSDRRFDLDENVVARDLDPWVEATKKYTLGSRHTGKVVRLQPFGVFVELEDVASRFRSKLSQ